LSLPTEHSQRPKDSGSAMKTVLFFLMISGAMCQCIAQTDQRDAHEKSASTRARKDDSLICSISVDEIGWHEPKPVGVAVVIENRSEADVNVPVVPSFILSPLAPAMDPQKGELNYVALWDFEKGTTLSLSSTIPLQVKAGVSRKINSDIASLLWSRVNWSVLPHSKLYKVVPAGRYSLRLELTGNDGKTLCSSNAVDVTIK